MPWLVNGIGTWYWGKANIHQEVGICEFCQQLSELRSYDTNLWFVIALIPILPLGKKRVLAECKRCERHRVMKRKDWYKKKEEDIAHALSQFQQNPQEKTLQDTLDILMAYQDREAFIDLAATVLHRPNTQAETFLILGIGYEKFQDLPHAEEAYQRSLQLDPKQEIRNYLARVLLIQKRPDEAVPLLKPIFDQKLADFMGFIFLLVEGFQAEGRHQDALDTLEQCQQHFPEVKQAPLSQEFERYYQLASKNLVRNKKIKAPHLIPIKLVNPKTQLWKNRLWKLFFISLFAISFLGFAIESDRISKARKVYLVNGLAQSYDVEIQSKKFHLEPNATKIIEIPEGAYPIKVISSDLKIPEQMLRLETSFWLRPFFKNTYILNPDQAALIVFETREYFKNRKHLQSSYVPPPFQLLSGSLLYDLSGVDYPFTPFPNQTKIRSSKESKKGVYLLPTVDPQQRVEILQTKLGKTGCKNYLQKQLDYNPRQKEYLFSLSSFLPPEEMIAFLEKRLKERPVLVDWHLLYQSLLGMHRVEQNLEQIYRQYVEKEQDSGDLFYLLAKTTPSDLEAYTLYEKATKALKPSADAFHELAFRALSHGKFEEALSLTTQGNKLGSTQFDGFILRESLWALKKYPALLKAIQEKKKQYPLDGEWIVEEICVLKKMQQQARIEIVTAEFFKEFSNYANPTVVASWKQYFHAVEAYQDQNFKKFAQILHQMESPHLKLQGFVVEGKTAEALDVCKQLSPPDPFEFLQIYLAARVVKDEKTAEEALALAVVNWSESGRPFERNLARIFQNEQVPNPQDILQFVFSPSQKLPLCLALGLKFPEQKALYWEFAKKLNYRPTYPFFLYQKVFESF